MLLAACAVIPTVRSSPATVAAYQAVRSGARPAAAGGDIEFCAGPDAVVAQRAKWRPSDDYAARYRDYAVADQVRAALRYQPPLPGISARVEQGAVRLDGHVPSDATAAEAIARALDVDGVVLVEARLFTPDATTPPAFGSARWCD
jgi:osmotically-inducible protein OsmY